MLFHCTKGACRFWGEGAAMPDACPRCGGALTAGERAKMSGDDWCALGVFWMEQDGAEEKAVSCFRRAARLGSVQPGPVPGAGHWDRGRPPSGSLALPAGGGDGEPARPVQPGGVL